VVGWSKEILYFSAFLISLIADVGPRSNTHAGEREVVESMDFKT
jgi:hypothetical protein